MRPPLFNTSTSTSLNRFSNSTRQEIDLRSEFDILVFGDENNIPHGHWVIIRNMRRDNDGYPTKCVCMEVENTIGPDPDCSYCSGEGFLFDEHWAYIYSVHVTPESGLVRKYIHVAPGLERTDYLVFFLRYDETILDEDKIIEVKLDTEGGIITPFVRKAFYKPQTIAELRSDYGRLEFYAVFCKEDEAIYPDNPV